MNIQPVLTPGDAVEEDRERRTSFFGRRRSDPRASSHMLRLQLLGLEIRLRTIDESKLTEEYQKRIYQEIKALLASATVAATAGAEDWDLAYRIERLMVLLFGREQLQQEIAARLLELGGAKAPEAERLVSEYALLNTVQDGKSTADETVLRHFLLRVLETQHWAAKKKYLAAPIRTEATKKILLLAILAFLLVVIPYIGLVWATWSGSPPTVSVERVWSLFPLYTAITTGLLGAFFSRLIMLQRQWDTMTLEDVYLHREWTYILLRASVGMGGSLILFFFLQSGLVGGDLFPNLREMWVDVAAPKDRAAVGMTLLLPSKNLSLLIVWSFLAGFSEVLVSSILTSTEGRMTKATVVAK